MSNFRHVDDLGSYLLTSNIIDANNVNLTNRFLLFCRAKCESSLALAYISMLSHKSKIKPRSCDTRHVIRHVNTSFSSFINLILLTESNSSLFNRSNK